jgi:ribonuclease BN (tRNA processing enzyme)
MKLTVLGGAAAGAGAGIGCSGYLIQGAESAIVVDLGPSTVTELKRHIDPRDLAGIIITHGHLDHTLDLGTLRYSLKYSPSAATSPIELWIPPGCEHLLEHLAIAYAAPPDTPSDFYDGVYSTKTFNPAEPLCVGEFTVTFHPTIHYVPTWATRIVSSQSPVKIGYTADTGPAADLHQTLSGVDLLVCEATLLEPGNEPFESRGHLTAAEAGALAVDTGCRILLLTHLYDEIVHEQTRRVAHRNFTGRVEIARPGLTVEL